MANQHGWSNARRAAQSVAIRRWQPWRASTGPKTAAGKAVSARNGIKPVSAMRAELIAMQAELNELRRLVSRVAAKRLRGR
jgi:hypothetical protein